MPKLKIAKPVAEGYTIFQKAFVSRLKPNGATEQLFDKIAGTCRFVYNGALHQRRAFYDMGLKTPTAFDQIKVLTQAKQNPDLAFLSDAPIHCLQQAMIDVATAFDNFFADLKKQATGLLKAKDVRRPKKHKKGKCRDSFRFPDPKQFVIERKRVKLPKIGWVNFFDSRKIEGTPKSVTVFKDGKHWFMSVLCEIIAPIPVPPKGEPIGIDLNVEEGAAVALSDGRCLETAKTSKREQRFLRKLKRTVSRRFKGSVRYAKAVERLAKFEKFRANRRKDAIHKVTTQLAKTHGVLVIEDLKVKNMTASAAGTVEEPGKNVKAKSGLNRVILDRAFGFVRQCLAYKTAWYGSEVRKRPAPYTSQKCSCCGHIDAANRKGSWFCCLKCGHAESAHTNAAKNILADGLEPVQETVRKAATDRGETVRLAVRAGNLREAITLRGDLVTC
jgi:putative transposase